MGDVHYSLFSKRVGGGLNFSINTRRLVLKKLFFWVGEYAEYGFDQQG